MLEEIKGKKKLKRYAAAAAKSLQSCWTLCDPIVGSPPGSPIPGILQARTLELVPLLFLPAPQRPLPALLLLLLAPPPRPPRYSQACYYAGEKGLLGPSLPLHTSAPGLLMAGLDLGDVPNLLESSSQVGRNQRG